MDGAKNMPPIYCISLARAEERRAAMRRRLDLLGAPYEMIDAVDGRELDLAKMESEGRLRQDVCMRRLGRKLNAGEVGCYLSHYNLWERIAAENIKTALVLEDDADWGGDFAPAVCAMQNIPHEWDVVLLSVCKKIPVDSVVCRIGETKYSLVRYKQQALTTAGYLINSAGAKKLLDFGRVIADPVDVLYSAYWRTGIAFYCVYPMGLVRQSEPESVIAPPRKRESPLKYRIMSSMRRKRDRILIRLYNWTHPVK